MSIISISEAADAFRAVLTFWLTRTKRMWRHTKLWRNPNAITPVSGGVRRFGVKAKRKVCCTNRIKSVRHQLMTSCVVAGVVGGESSFHLAWWITRLDSRYAGRKESSRHVSKRRRTKRETQPSTLVVHNVWMPFHFLFIVPYGVVCVWNERQRYSKIQQQRKKRHQTLCLWGGKKRASFTQTRTCFMLKYYNSITMLSWTHAEMHDIKTRYVVGRDREKQTHENIIPKG